MSTYPLGRHPDASQHHDPRSLNFPARRATALTSVIHRHYGMSLDQGNLGSCTGNALAHAKNTVPLHKTGEVLKTETDAVTAYKWMTVHDPYSGTYPPTDTGSDGLTAAKYGVYAGWCGSYGHAFGLDWALHSLVLSPVMFGTNWYDSMFDTDDRYFVNIADGAKIAGGHEWCAIGLNVTGKYIIAVNSWGNEWGHDGRFRVHFSTLDRLLSEGGDATVLYL